MAELAHDEQPQPDPLPANAVTFLPGTGGMDWLVVWNDRHEVANVSPVPRAHMTDELVERSLAWALGWMNTPTEPAQMPDAPRLVP